MGPNQCDRADLSATGHFVNEVGPFPGFVSMVGPFPGFSGRLGGLVAVAVNPARPLLVLADLAFGVSRVR
jgi:hypothetical protein